MSKLAGAVGVACALVSGAASAGLYGGGVGTLSERNGYSDIERVTGFGAFAGYRFDEMPLIIELGYLDAGDADVEDTGGITLGYTGLSVALGWYGKLSNNGSGAWIRGGFYTGDSKVTDTNGVISSPGSYVEESTNGFVWGAGVDLMVTEWFGFRLGFDSYVGVKDFAEDENMTAYSFGIVLHLPSSGSVPAGAPVFRAPEPYMPPQAQPAPMPPAALVAEQPEPAPAAAPVPMTAVSGLSLLVVDASVRAQPRMQAQTEAVLPANQTVTARNRVSNAEGRWWFVQHENVRGWVPESAFDPTTLPR